MKKTISVFLLAVLAFGLAVNAPVLAASACPDGYSSNGYFNGSWFDFSSNSTVQSMILSGELARVFTTNGDGVSAAIPTKQFAIACVAPTFSIQTSGARGLYLVGSGWSNAGFDYSSLVSIVNSYLSTNFIFPTTTTSTTTTTTTSTTTTTTVPAPTTTAATTTTTVASSGYYCLKPGGIGINLVWINSSTLNFTNPIYRTTPYTGVIVMTSATWNSKSDVEKSTYNMNEVAVKPIPIQGCSSLNQTLVLPTTTTLPSTTVPSSTSSTAVIGATSTTTVSGSQTSTNNSNKSVATTTTTPRPQISGIVTTVPKATKTCPPSADSLYIYNYFYDGLVTNHGGRFDSGSSSSKFDWTRDCSVSPITKLLIRDNFSVTETANLDLKLNINKMVSNCWQIARVSAFGQSDWSNQVCYTVPVVPQTQVTTSVPLEVVSSKIVPRGVTGAQCFDGYRTKVRSSSACKDHFGRDFWLFKKFAVGYNPKYRPSLPISTTGGATGRCVGICYGVPSTVNGLPRNTYVSGYFRKDGTYVRPYTRSKP